MRGYIDLAIDRTMLCVDRVTLLAPDIEIAIIAGQQVSIHESRKAPIRAIAVSELSGLWYDDGEAPAICTSVPLPMALAADRSIESNVAGNNVVVVNHSLSPGVHVFEQPGPVLVFAGHHVGVHCQRGGK